MRWKALRWYDLALPLLALVFPLWTYALSWANEKRQAGRHLDDDVREALVDGIFALKYWLPILVVIVILIINIIKVGRDSSPKKTIKKFLNLLHETHFPHTAGGLNPRYRVSLFVPTKLPFGHKYLSLYARSGDLYPKSRVKWDVTASEEGNYDGIAGHAWVTGNFIDIPDLPPYDGGTEAEKRQYMRTGYLSQDKAYKVNVHSRSYQALVIKNRMDEKIALLMMECEDPNGLANLTAEKWGEIAKTLQCLASA